MHLKFHTLPPLSSGLCQAISLCLEMIDLNTYRQRIGGFNTYCKRSKRERRDRRGMRDYVGVGENQNILDNMFIVMYYIFILYVFMLGSSCTIQGAAGICGSRAITHNWTWPCRAAYFTYRDYIS